MSNPISGLWNVAVGGWHALIDGYNTTWRDMYDVATFAEWRPHVNAAFTYLARIIQDVTVLAATSDADTVEIGRDTAVFHREALEFLQYPLIPRWAGNARQAAVRHADAIVHFEALARIQAVYHEALDRQLGDLRERLAMDVAVAQEHADMVTRVAIEANDRVLMVQHEALDRQQGDQAEAQARVAMVRHEALDRQQADAQLLKYAQSIIPAVDVEAAGGYDPTLKDHVGVLTRLLDTAVAHEPLIADLVGKLAGWLVDLAEVDDPLIRIAATLLLRELIDRFGLDTALGRLLSDLLGPVLGSGPPKTLKATEAQVGSRLNAIEDGVAALSPLAPEADNLHELGTLAFDAALLGYLAAAVADPVAAADDTAAVLDSVVTPLLGPVRGLLGMP